MKRLLLIVIAVLIILGGLAAWKVFGSATGFQREKYDLYIRTGMTYDQLLTLLEKDTVINSPTMFNWMAGALNYKLNVKAGKYEIKKGTGLLSMIRVLKNGRQTPVHFTVGKVRTREGLAGMVGRKLECDSLSMLHFLQSNDSLKAFGVDSNTFFTLILPNTYTYNWNITPASVLKKMEAYSKEWWTPERIKAAEDEGLTQLQAYILASIVEEETNVPADKGKIASVYLNRMEKGMKLAADPTVKYATRDFEMKHIYFNTLKIASPYNTYIHPGLPPGPICTPMEQTLEAVIHAPKTDYLFFAAAPDFTGTVFSATFKEHLENANAYRKELRTQEAIRDSINGARTGGTAAVKGDKDTLHAGARDNKMGKATAGAKGGKHSQRTPTKPVKKKHR